MSGAVEILGHNGQWALRVNGGTPRVFRTFEEALVQAAAVTFAPGESPGSWRVSIIER